MHLEEAKWEPKSTLEVDLGFKTGHGQEPSCTHLDKVKGTQVYLR